jgi:hypothetical protein
VERWSGGGKVRPAWLCNSRRAGAPCTPPPGLLHSSASLRRPYPFLPEVRLASESVTDLSHTSLLISRRVELFYAARGTPPELGRRLSCSILSSYLRIK